MLAGGEREAGDILMGDLLPVKGDLAAVWQQTQDAFHKGRFTRAVFAEKPDDLALADIKIDAVKGALERI